jgi:hypothetical protein
MPGAHGYPLGREVEAVLGWALVGEGQREGTERAQGALHCAPGEAEG